MKIGYAIVFVSDMQGATSFYRDVLGLPLRFASTEWTEFATDGATLALHATDAAAGESPAVKNPGACRIGLHVADVDAFHARMVEAGVPCVEAPRVEFGAKLAQYSAPDGMVFSVGESRES